jgi:hypothetical protein
LDLQPTSPEHDVLTLRRQDLADLTALYLRQNRTPRLWAPVVIGIAGIAAGAVLIPLGDHLGWPSALDPVFFFGGWAVMAGAGVTVFRRAGRLRRHFRFACPACEAPLLDGIRGPTDLARVEMIIATGNCTRCGATILE